MKKPTGNDKNKPKKLRPLLTVTPLNNPSNVEVNNKTKESENLEKPQPQPQNLEF